MNRILFILLLMLAGGASQAQKVDSIFFHLYTDSLKKGTHNYINVDGKLSNGRWMPLSAKEIKFTASACHFSGNELVIPPDFTGEKITIKAELKTDPKQVIERTIWIKKNPDPDKLPSVEEVLKENGRKNKRKQ